MLAHFITAETGLRVKFSGKFMEDEKEVEKQKSAGEKDLQPLEVE